VLQKQHESHNATLKEERENFAKQIGEGNKVIEDLQQKKQQEDTDADNKSHAMLAKIDELKKALEVHIKQKSDSDRKMQELTMKAQQLEAREYDQSIAINDAKTEREELEKETEALRTHSESEKQSANNTIQELQSNMQNLETIVKNQVRDIDNLKMQKQDFECEVGACMVAIEDKWKVYVEKIMAESTKTVNGMQAKIQEAQQATIAEQEHGKLLAATTKKISNTCLVR
jgi:chromosome segregation ATPase